MPVGEIAHACGYSTTDGMRLAFDRNLGVTPREYRLRFCGRRSRYLVPSLLKTQLLHVLSATSTADLIRFAIEQRIVPE